MLLCKVVPTPFKKLKVKICFGKHYNCKKETKYWCIKGIYA